jgi:hypothetical protein
MRKINFTTDVLPHIVAVGVFLVVTLIFFGPVFFDNKSLSQQDIRQHLSSSRELRDFRNATGEEGLWVGSMFSGMPAYLVNLDWSDEAIVAVKRVLTLFLVHPVCNIFAALVSFYILLLSFKVRPYLAIGGALAFGLSSYMIIGLAAGHNSRIGAIAFMPLAMAGIHLVISGKRIVGFAVTAAGMALHLRENHLQITYYFLIIVGIYGLVHLIFTAREKQLASFFKSIGVLVAAVLIAAATFFGQFWAITEYTRYSIRGPSELQAGEADVDGLNKSYAFGYGIGAAEPLTLLIPDFFGGNGSRAFVQDEESATYRALVSSGDNETANQLAQFSGAYWGGHTPTPYYAGAIVVFLFVLGLAFAEKQFIWWLAPVAVLSILMSVGESFSSFNYFLFDYLPGYNKFRSTTFAFIMILFAMPLLGLIGLERMLAQGPSPRARRKLLIAGSVVGGLCLLLAIFGGVINLIASEETDLPAWFLNALESDRLGVLRGEAFRSFGFIFSIFILLYLDAPRRISTAGFYAFLAFMITVDLAVVDKRYFTEDNYQRKRTVAVETTEADQEVMKDKGYYRVFDLQEPFGISGTSSFHHNSLGGYHGAKMRRYQDLYDSCLGPQLRQLMSEGQRGDFDFASYTAFNMLNTKYFMYGPARNNIIRNPYANGPAWFVRDVVKVNTPAEELAAVCRIDTRQAAVIDVNKFKPAEITSFDSSATVSVVDRKPYSITYEAASANGGLIVFSEIYYPKGWYATINGADATILRANYVLRALNVPPGKNTIAFSFQPRPYTIGNKVTMASSWLLVLVVAGCLAWSLKREQATEKP